MKDLWTLLAIISALPGAYFSFRRSFFRDLKDQMVGEGNPGGVGVNTIPASYRFFAYIFIGERKRWIDIFDPSSDLYKEIARKQKTDGHKVFVCFTHVFVLVSQLALSRGSVGIRNWVS